jgi:thioredoxin-like negative regulator of GroEL
MSVFQINPEDFEREILHEERMSLVLFWAPSSHESKEVLNLLEPVSGDYAEYVKFAALNSVHSIELSEYYNVKAVPAILYFWKGKEIGRSDGYASIKNINSVIDRILKVYKIVEKKHHF